MYTWSRSSCIHCKITKTVCGVSFIPYLHQFFPSILTAKKMLKSTMRMLAVVSEPGATDLLIFLIVYCGQSLYSINPINSFNQRPFNESSRLSPLTWQMKPLCIGVAGWHIQMVLMHLFCIKPP